MPKTIWKFELEAASRQAIEMPKGAEVLCVQMQHALHVFEIHDGGGK